MFDDEDVPATREEFRKLRRQLKETRIYVQELRQQQIQIAEDADTWIKVAREMAQVARKEARDTRKDAQEKTVDITEVFRVQRDLIEDLRAELHSMREEWADDGSWAYRMIDTVTETVSEIIEKGIFEMKEEMEKVKKILNKGSKKKKKSSTKGFNQNTISPRKRGKKK